MRFMTCISRQEAELKRQKVRELLKTTPEKKQEK
jgi:hypothetical protein